jgi:hypothetical protein
MSFSTPEQLLHGIQKLRLRYYKRVPAVGATYHSTRFPQGALFVAFTIIGVYFHTAKRTVHIHDKPLKGYSKISYQFIEKGAHQQCKREYEEHHTHGYLHSVFLDDNE